MALLSQKMMPANWPITQAEKPTPQVDILAAMLADAAACNERLNKDGSHAPHNVGKRTGGALRPHKNGNVAKIEAILSEWMTRRDVIEATGIPTKQVESAMTHLMAHGRIEKRLVVVGRGRIAEWRRIAP